jgi:hypothetical protein
MMMSAIDRIARNRDRRDDVPNQELARDLAKERDVDGIAEIVDHLDDGDRRIASDCIKVLYEIGYIEPTLIGPYTGTFIDLLGSKQNRMVWGAMIALWTVADTRAMVIWDRMDEVVAAIEKGSVITRDAGVKTLAVVASKDSEREDRLRPILFGILRECEAKRVASFAEDMTVMVNDGNLDEFLSIVTARHDELTVPQARRLGKVIDTLTR